RDAAKTLAMKPTTTALLLALPLTAAAAPVHAAPCPTVSTWIDGATADELASALDPSLVEPDGVVHVPGALRLVLRATEERGRVHVALGGATLTVDEDGGIQLHLSSWDGATIPPSTPSLAAAALFDAMTRAVETTLVWPESFVP